MGSPFDETRKVLGDDARRRTVFIMLDNGATSAEIARALHLSRDVIHTVKIQWETTRAEDVAARRRPR